MDEKREDSGLPLLVARGEGIAEAWENSILELNKNGKWYNRGDPDDNGKQVDARMVIEVKNPDANPFLHKYMGCDARALLDYLFEVHGARDVLRKDLNDPTDAKWDYLYHERLEGYPTSQGPFNQIDAMVRRLAERPFSRRVGAITWVPERDTKAKDTPCLQRMSFLIVPGEDGVSWLNLTYTFRSRNAMTASPMNMTGFHSLQTRVRDEITALSGLNLRNGSIVDFTDAYHISTRDQPILQQMFLSRYAKSCEKNETLADRTYTRGTTIGMMEEYLPDVVNSIMQQMDNTYEQRFSAAKGRFRVMELKSQMEAAKEFTLKLAEYFQEKFDKGNLG